MIGEPRYFCGWCCAEHEALTPEQVKGLYSHVCKTGRFPGGVADARHVEHALGKDIPNTAEFHRLVDEWLTKKSGTSLTPGEQLRRQRRSRRLTQVQLARELGVSKMMVCHYEHGQRPLSRAALEWLNGEQPAICATRGEAENTSPRESKLKMSSEPNSSDPPILGLFHMGGSKQKNGSPRLFLKNPVLSRARPVFLRGPAKNYREY